MNLWPFNPAETEALLLSVKVASASVVLSLPPGIGLAWLLARRRFPGRTLLQVVIDLPLVMPPVVTGYLLLVLFGRNGPAGALLERWLGWRIVFDWKGAALASAVVAFPLLVGSIRLAFAGVDPRLEQASRSLGAGPLETFRRVSLPLARRGVIAGAVLGFARSLGEFGATNVIAGSIPGETRTVPLFIYGALESPGGGSSVRGLVIASILISAGALLAGDVLERRGRP